MKLIHVNPIRREADKSNDHKVYTIPNLLLSMDLHVTQKTNVTPPVQHLNEVLKMDETFFILNKNLSTVKDNHRM